ncbi:RNA:NAD 2'-phosphotransferase (TPT1/KptA family) [Mucilaginibacter sp. UYNi724]
MSKLQNASKLISYWLRHSPADANLSANEFGWVSLPGLINALEANGVNLTVDEIVILNLSFDKIRWEFDNVKQLIRATHGHSISVIVSESQAVPPEVLYHGTTVDSLTKIILEGLKPMGRQYIHLSSSKDVAIDVARRHGKPLIIEIAAKDIHDNGDIFYKTSDNVWLALHVPLPNISISGWHGVTRDEKERLLKELKRELSYNYNILRGVNDLTLILRRHDLDDCLFLHMPTGKVYELHLIWNIEESPNFPSTVEFQSLAAWINSSIFEE